jgi:hypothetical protein
MPSELDILQAPAGIEFDAEMNFIAACRIIAMHSDRSVDQISKIPRPA